MYGMQFMCHTRGRQGQKYSSLQFWRGRIKMHGSMPIHMLQARQHQRQIHIIILTFSMIIRDQMLGIV